MPNQMLESFPVRTLRRFAERVRGLRGYAATGALLLLGFVVAKLIADLPRLQRKLALDGWGPDVLSGVAMLVALLAGAAAVGALIGLVMGALIQWDLRRRSPARPTLPGVKRLPE